MDWWQQREDHSVAWRNREGIVDDAQRMDNPYTLSGTGAYYYVMRPAMKTDPLTETAYVEV